MCYGVSILSRTSLSAVGVEAAVRYEASAATLAIFSVLQLVVYGVLQIPVGLMLDRFGARTIITCGMATMAIGQLVLALSHSVPEAIIARVLVGAGDAMVFPSILRILPGWFPARRVPLIVQATSLLGQFGQIVAVIPLHTLVQLNGWTAAFLSVAGFAGLAAVIAIAFVREKARTSVASPTPRRHELLTNIAIAWKQPGTRLAFWIHFTTPFAATTFALVWGFPFLTESEGTDTATAGNLITLYVLAGIIVGPVIGTISGSFASRRLHVTLTAVLLQVTVWTAVIVWPGPAPLPLLIALMIALATGNPGSMVAFDCARAHNPTHRLSTATGIVNMAGFIAALIAIYLVGLTLDLQGARPGQYTQQALRTAMCSQYLIWTVGLVGIAITHRKAVRNSSVP